MNEPDLNFSLQRGEAATLIFALEEYIRATKKDLARARKATRHTPGKVAECAVGIADAHQLRQRLMSYMVDNGWLTLKPRSTPEGGRA